MINRRAILAAPLALAACGGTPSKVDIPALAKRVKIVVDGLVLEMPAIAALGAPLGITPQVLDTLQAAVAELQTAAQAFLTASTAAEAQPIAQKLQAYLSAFTAVLVAVPLPPQIKAPVDAAAALIPILGVLVGLAVVK